MIHFDPKRLLPNSTRPLLNETLVSSLGGLFEAATEDFFKKAGLPLTNVTVKLDTDQVHYHMGIRKLWDKLTVQYFVNPSFIYIERSNLLRGMDPDAEVRAKGIKVLEGKGVDLTSGRVCLASYVNFPLNYYSK